MRVGFVGWRGMVGSVLIERMIVEKDFDCFKSRFFSTSNAGDKFPKKFNFNGDNILFDAFDLEALSECDLVLTCQGSTYSSQVYKNLRNNGWPGYWVDASKYLRMSEDAVLVLDPINKNLIDRALNSGIKNFIGSNCTVSCLLMAIGGLIKENLVDWVCSSTYQAASGAGANHIRELINQMGKIYGFVDGEISNPNKSILEIDSMILRGQQSFSVNEKSCFGVPLAGSLIPWIDVDLGNGVSLEENKGFTELNKLLGKNLKKKDEAIPVDFTCTRVGSFRCHSQSLVLKLKKNISLESLQELIKSGNEWVEIIPNSKEETVQKLTPVAVSGSLSVPFGRLRKLNYGSNFLGGFTVADQLLWGAAEPLRRITKYLVGA